MIFGLYTYVASAKEPDIKLGTVEAIMTAEMYISTTRTDLSGWDTKFPGWRKRAVYWIKLLSPQRNISIEDFTSLEINKGKDEETIRIQYEAIPYYNFIAVVQDDLLEYY